MEFWVYGGVLGGSWKLWLRSDKIWAQKDTPHLGSFQIPRFLLIFHMFSSVAASYICAKDAQAVVEAHEAVLEAY